MFVAKHGQTGFPNPAGGEQSGHEARRRLPAPIPALQSSHVPRSCLGCAGGTQSPQEPEDTAGGVLEMLGSGQLPASVLLGFLGVTFFELQHVS